MNRFLLLVLLFSSVELFSQLEVVWQKPNFPTILDGPAFFSKDGRYLYGKLGDRIRILDATNGEHLEWLDTNSYYKEGLRISRHRNYLYSYFHIWDLNEKKHIFNQVSEGIDISPNEDFAIYITKDSLYKVDFKTKVVLQFKKYTFEPRYIKFLNNSNRFITGTSYKYIDKYYIQVDLWDADSMKVIKTLFKKETNQIESWLNSKFQISENDKYLCYRRDANHDSYIFDLETNKIIFLSNPNNYSGSIYMLQDNFSYLVAYMDPNDNYFMEYRNLKDELVNTYANSDSWIVDSYKDSENVKIFLGNFNNNMSLLKPTLAGVEIDPQEEPNLEISYIENKLKIKSLFNIIGSSNLSISNLQGQLLFNFSNIEFINNEASIPIPLQNGTYFCTITTPANTYSQQFNVVR